MSTNKYPNLTSPIKLGNLYFRNRIFSAPMGATDITPDCYPGLRITDEGVICKDSEGNEVLVPGKTVICAVGQRANRADVDALRFSAPFVREVGDCVRPANITKAVYEGYYAALDI